MCMKSISLLLHSGKGNEGYSTGLKVWGCQLTDCFVLVMYSIFVPCRSEGNE